MSGQTLEPPAPPLGRHIGEIFFQRVHTPFADAEIRHWR